MSSPPAPAVDGITDPRVAFCLELGRSLHAFGISAHRFEAAMERVARRLGLEPQFFALPTGWFASLDGRTYTMRAESGDANLAKIDRLWSIVRAVVDGQLGLAEAEAELRALAAARPVFRRSAVVAAFALASGTSARFLGGGGRDAFVSAGLGLGVGLLAVAIKERRAFAQVFHLLAALLVAFAAVALSHAVPGTSALTLTLAGIIILLPGLRLTVGLREISTGNLVSGSARLADAGMILLMQGFGVAVGRQAAAVLLGLEGREVTAAVAAWSEWVALGLAPIALLVLFQGRPRDLGWAMLGVLTAWLGARLGARGLGAPVGAAVGACVLGVAANLVGRLRRRPEQLVLLPGLLLLVPGSLGFRGVAALSTGQTVIGIETAFEMIFLGVALVAGLSLANALVPPSREI